MPSHADEKNSHSSSLTQMSCLATGAVGNVYQAPPINNPENPYSIYGPPGPVTV